VPVVLPVLIGVSVIAPLPLAVTVPAVIVPTIADVQVYVVPPTVAVGVKFNAVPLHICGDNKVELVVITVIGFTVTLTVTGVPEHPFALGVIW
jgi:hypothetical protein